MKQLAGLKPRIVSLAVICWLAAGPALAGEPADQIKATIDRVLAVLQDAKFKGPDKQAERREKLKSIIYPQFDFAEMAKRSLGRHWPRQTAAEQQTFVELFTDLLQASYVDAIESYDGEKVSIGKERQDQGFADVNTTIVNKKGETFALNYRLHQVGGGWKVYDVAIENISLVNNYRSQFDRVIARSSFEELLNKMKAKQFDAPRNKTKT